MPDPENRLTLIREISRSGIATVWEAYDAGLDRKVLVKSISPQYARESDLRARFEREARAIARLSHPSVVQIYDLRVTNDELSLVLEFVDGVTLGALLKDRGTLPVEVAVAVASEILSGLEIAHTARIVHRDLKPDNVMISRKGEVKITDFGLATLKDLPTVTVEGMVVGTPSYMAPEQAGGGEVTPRTDLFALGLMLFEMLTGQVVIPGATRAEAYVNALNYAAPRLELYGDAIPETLRPVLARLLEKSPDKRYATASEVRAALAASQPQVALPIALLRDYLSGEPVLRPVAKKAVTSRVRPLWLQRFAWITGALIIILLAFHFGTIRRPLPKSVQETDGRKDSLTHIAQDSFLTSSVAADCTHLLAQDDDKQLEEPVEVKQNRLPDLVSRIPTDTASTPSATLLQDGFLFVQCKPWARIFLRDSLWGTTPLALPLKMTAGTYDLVLVNPEIQHPIIRNVKVRSGQTDSVNVNLYDFVGRIRAYSVKPWADMYVDGIFELRTPSSKTIYRPFGKHIIALKHPDLPPDTIEITLRQGDPIFEIRADLTDTTPKTKKQN
jgi:serine/threonine protein kinase